MAKRSNAGNVNATKKSLEGKTIINPSENKKRRKDSF